MMLRLDGRRLDQARAEELLGALVLDDLAAALARDGWRPAPSRAPRNPRNGRVAIRLTWTRQMDGGCQVLRVTHIAQVLPRP